MSFRANPHQQISLDDSVFCGLTERERRALDGSWAKVFGDEVFPMIDESRFSTFDSTFIFAKCSTHPSSLRRTPRATT